MLRLYNSLTKKIELFEPRNGREVKMYTCGPSTYQRAHIGNYRTFLFEDILHRYLEYLGFNVKRLMTLTDLEDKAIEQAKKENVSVRELTSRNEDVFFKDFKILKIKRPSDSIRASTAIDQSEELISKLLAEGFAYNYNYKGEKNVYFNPLKFEGFGKLAHLNMIKWPKKKRRFHKDTYPGTPWNRGDFVLWHGCRQRDTCFDTKIGRGRPAWNIQDAAIVTKHLGFEVDVVCGGIDNLVRHHDYTLAIVEAISGKLFSRFWLHGGHLLVDGKKMSKSKGNTYYTDDVLSRGFSGKQLRFFLISKKHYRKKLNFTFEKLGKTSQKLDFLREMVAEIQKTKPKSQTTKRTGLVIRIIAEFEDHMNNDLDLQGAFNSLCKVVSAIYEKREMLTAQEKENILVSLEKVDSVLQSIF